VASRPIVSVHACSFSTTRSTINSSAESANARNVTKTGDSCPIRCARASACAVLVGVGSMAWKMTLLLTY
jgi:hypothetical protein